MVHRPGPRGGPAAGPAAQTGRGGYGRPLPCGTDGPSHRAFLRSFGKAGGAFLH